MIGNLTLRPVETDDAIPLQRTCWPYLTPAEVQWWLTSLSERRERGLAWGIVALVDGVIAGYGQLTRLGGRAEISDLIVGESWRGQGVGTAIITCLIEMARSQRFLEVEIGVAESNPRALRLYRRLGFREKRRIMLDLGNGDEPVIYLGLNLDRAHL
jgi:ribosomal-protein-alanine N-acetyltransferase